MSKIIVALAFVAFILNIHFTKCHDDSNGSYEERSQNALQREERVYYNPQEKVDLTDPRFRTYDKRWVRLLKRFQDGLLRITTKDRHGDRHDGDTRNSYDVERSFAQMSSQNGGDAMLLPPGI